MNLPQKSINIDSTIIGNDRRITVPIAFFLFFFFGTISNDFFVKIEIRRVEKKE